MPGDCTVMVAEYARRWLAVVGATRKPSTTRRYEQIVRCHLLPRLGHLRLADVSRSVCRDALVDILESGGAPATVRAVLAVLQALLSAAALDDELIPGNPALGLGRRLRLVKARIERQDEIRALTMAELRTFLDSGWEVAGHLAPIFETYGRAGLRLGEALALRWEDVAENSIRVSRTYSDREISSPKSGVGRTVEIGDNLAKTLNNVPRVSEWCFPSLRTGRLWDPTYIERVCRKIGDEVGLQRVHPHTLRHTYASLLLAQGEPPEWVSRQLGHSRLDLTIVVYGRWIQARNPAGLRHFDAQLSTGELRPRVRRRVKAGVRLLPGGRVD